MKTYPALVLAGYSPDKPDPLAAAMGMERKALLPIAGKPMVYWVVRALQESGRIDDLFIVGMSEEDGVDFGQEVTYVPNQARHFDNIMAGVRAIQEKRPDAEYAVGASADIPLLKPSTVEWFLDACERRGGDIFYSLVEMNVMESQFPGSGRSYVPLVEGRFCGGDLYLARLSVAHNNEELVRGLLERRKNAFQQIRMAGFRIVLKFLFRRLSLKDAEEVASRLMQCEARAMPSPFADLGMDIDKPHQWEMARRILEARVQREA